MKDLFWTPWTAARQASLSMTNSQSLLKLMSMKLVMPSNHLILCRPLFLPSSIFPSLRVFSNELVLCIRWPKYWSFSFSISPANGYSGLIPLGWTGWISLQSKGLSRVFSNTTVQKHQYTYINAAHRSWTWLHMDITRWSTLKSDWLYSLRPKMEKLYTVSKNKTRSWLWLRSWTPYCQIQT